MATTILALAVALLLVLGLVEVSSMLVCEIDCSRYPAKDKADDPVDCHKYYFCFSVNSHSEMSFTCLPGEDFDTRTKKCMSKWTPGFACSPPCERCSFDCALTKLGKAASQYECSVYYVCDGIGGIYSTEVCDSNAPYFDGSNCQSDKNKCCTCKPDCTANDVTNHHRVPDYKNCTNYYLCVTVGVPSEDSHGHCERGNFNYMTRDCEEGTPCIAPCQDGPVTGTCDNNFICQESGYFPKCTNICDPHYYYCTLQDIGHPVEAKICTHNNVIDPHKVQCVPPEECPCPCKKVMQAP